SSRRRHTRFSLDWSSDVCSSDLESIRLHAPRQCICPGWLFSNSGKQGTEYFCKSIQVGTGSFNLKDNCPFCRKAGITYTSWKTLPLPDSDPMKGCPHPA